jgi:RNA polymerase sigma factor (TIGR02999 family)
VNGGDERSWQNRGHFYAAAAEAMRRILVENARRRSRVKHGADRERMELDSALVAPENDQDLLALDAALDRLAGEDPLAADVVKLRYFTGLTIPQAAELLEVSPRKADFLWSFARAWLRREIEGT